MSKPTPRPATILKRLLLLLAPDIFPFFPRSVLRSRASVDEVHRMVRRRQRGRGRYLADPYRWPQPWSV